MFCLTKYNKYIKVRVLASLILNKKDKSGYTIDLECVFVLICYLKNKYTI